MEIVKFTSYDELSKFASEVVKNEILKNEACVLGLATGSSPVGMYNELAKLNAQKTITFKNVKTVNLDEYVGLDGLNEQSYRYFMNTNLFDKIDIKKENTFVPNGKANDLQKECEDYEKLIESLGGVDLQVLGLGDNGHIGFNEPSEVYEKYTHLTNLKEETINANARFFDNADLVPKQALTMGIKSIMNARKILLIVNKKEKKEIALKALFGEITPLVPASVLQLHPNLVVAMID